MNLAEAIQAFPNRDHFRVMNYNGVAHVQVRQGVPVQAAYALYGWGINGGPLPIRNEERDFFTANSHVLNDTGPAMKRNLLKL